MESVIEYVSSYALETSNKTAVIVNGVGISYHALYSMVCGYASFLKKKD